MPRDYTRAVCQALWIPCRDDKWSDVVGVQMICLVLHIALAAVARIFELPYTDVLVTVLIVRSALFVFSFVLALVLFEMRTYDEPKLQITNFMSGITFAFQLVLLCLVFYK